MRSRPAHNPICSAHQLLEAVGTRENHDFRWSVTSYEKRTIKEFSRQHSSKHVLLWDSHELHPCLHERQPGNPWAKIPNHATSMGNSSSVCKSDWNNTDRLSWMHLNHAQNMMYKPPQRWHEHTAYRTSQVSGSFISTVDKDDPSLQGRTFNTYWRRIRNAVPQEQQRWLVIQNESQITELLDCPICNSTLRESFKHLSLAAKPLTLKLPSHRTFLRGGMTCWSKPGFGFGFILLSETGWPRVGQRNLYEKKEHVCISHDMSDHIGWVTLTHVFVWFHMKSSCLHT